jgi:hypothetical protein
MNRLKTDLVLVAPSQLILGESGLFARKDIEEGNQTQNSRVAGARPTRPPPPVVPDPESIDTQAPTEDGKALLPGGLRPELFPGIGVLPGPATESHIVTRETPVAQ